MKTATVVKCDGERALVKTLPKSGMCDSCKSPCAQRSCTSLKPVLLWAENKVGAVIENEVEVEQLSTSTGLISALFCMVLPLIAAVTAFVISKSYVEEGFAFLISFAAFAIAELLAVPLAKAYEKRHPTLNIVKNLENK